MRKTQRREDAKENPVCSVCRLKYESFLLHIIIKIIKIFCVSAALRLCVKISHLI